MAKRPKTAKGGQARRAAAVGGVGWGVGARGAMRSAVLLAALLIVAAGLFAYRGSFAGAFVLDDGPAIVLNPHIKSLWPLSRAMSAPTEVTVAGRPIVSLTLAINYALAAPDVRDVLEAPGPGAPTAIVERHARNLWGYHALNLAIHLAAALVLFGVVRRTIAGNGGPNRRQGFGGPPKPRAKAEGPPLRVRTIGATVALTIALIWCVHPLHTGSVTYIVQRAESLMGLFYLLTIYCAIRAHEPANRARWIAGSVAACALGMGSKEVMVTAPVMVGLWDWTFGNTGTATVSSADARETSAVDSGADSRASSRPDSRADSRAGEPADVESAPARGRLLLYAGLASTWVILAALMIMNPRPQSVGFGQAEWTWWSYLLTQSEVIVHYLRLAIVPQPLVLDYGWPAATSLLDVAPHVMLLVALFGGSVWAVWRRRPEGFIGAWFFLILAPTSSVVPVFTEIAAEHRMYLPLAAVVALVVAGVSAMLSRVGTGQRRAIGATLTAAVVITFSVMTDARNADYASDERIWLDTVQKRPRNARARNNYAVDLLLRNDPVAALPHLREAVALDPRHAGATANLGVALCRSGRCDEGIGHLERALSMDPAAPRSHRDLAEAYASLGRNRLAVDHFLKAVERQPDDAFLLNRAGWILATAPENEVRDGRKALALAERAVQLTRRSDEISLDTLGAALAENGRFAEAASAVADALAAARAHGNIAIIPELEQRLAIYRTSK